MGTMYDTGKHRWEYGQPIYQDGQAVRWLLGPCPKCGSVTSTYGGGYSCHNDHCPHSADNFACNAGPKPDWWNTDIRVFLDGNAWCATGAGFQNLQESPAGFGDSPATAVADLRHNAALRGGEAVPLESTVMQED